MTRLPLREFNRIESGSVASLEEEQVAGIVHNADRNAHVAALCFGFGGGDHRLDGPQIQELFRWQVGGGEERRKNKKQSNRFRHANHTSSSVRRAAGSRSGSRPAPLSSVRHP